MSEFVTLASYSRDVSSVGPGNDDRASGIIIGKPRSNRYCRRWQPRRRPPEVGLGIAYSSPMRLEPDRAARSRSADGIAGLIHDGAIVAGGGAIDVERGGLELDAPVGEENPIGAVPLFSWLLAMIRVQSSPSVS